MKLSVTLINFREVCPSLCRSRFCELMKSYIEIGRRVLGRGEEAWNSEGRE